MKEYFYKYQWIIVLITLLNIGNTYRLNKEALFILNSEKSKLYEIIDKNCHYSKRRSTISIYYNYTKYFITVSYEDCDNFKVNSKIPLFYDNGNDRFLLKKYASKNGNLIVSIGLLLFIILPLKFFSKIMNR